MSGTVRSEVWIIQDNDVQPGNPYIIVRSVRGGFLIWAHSREHAARIAGVEDAAAGLEVVAMRSPSPERQMKAMPRRVAGDARGFFLIEAIDADAFEGSDHEGLANIEPEAFFIVDEGHNPVGNAYLDGDEALVALAGYRSGQLPLPGPIPTAAGPP